MRRGEGQHASFAKALAHHPELVRFEIADTAVDEFRCGRTGAVPEVALVDDERAQAAAGRFTGHVHTGDATADHYQVVRIIQAGGVSLDPHSGIDAKGESPAAAP